MNGDRRKILEMLATGKITADEAEGLLAALEKGPAGAGAGTGPEKPKPKYVRVLVEDENAKGPTRVNVRVPIQLLRAGVKLTSLIPPEARDRVNSHLRHEGVPFDLSQVNAENLEDLVNQLDELTVDINENQTKVRVFCE